MKYIYILLFSFTFLILNSQKYTLFNEISPYPILYIIDGLKLSGDSLKELDFDPNLKFVRNIKKHAKTSIEENGQKYAGVIEINTRLLIVLNDLYIYKPKDKKEKLSLINQSDILSIEFQNKDEAMLIWGEKAKFGALVIKTKT